MCLEVGWKASITRSFSAIDVANFAGLSGDCNPLHMDEQYASESPFGNRIVHGMLVASLFSALIASKIPCKGSIYLAHSLQFRAPVLIDQPVTATIAITHIREDKPIVTLQTVCADLHGRTLIEGEAVVKVQMS